MTRYAIHPGPHREALASAGALREYDDATLDDAITAVEAVAGPVVAYWAAEGTTLALYRSEVDAEQDADGWALHLRVAEIRRVG